jgi:hypothetical protein
MTIDQQVRDRFDRLTDGLLPQPDLAVAIAAGRRRRRLRTASYAVGSLAVVAFAASAFVLPHPGGSPEPAPSPNATDDGTFVPGTTIDTDLASAVAAADPSLPTPTDVYPSDWNHDGPLPDADFANATEWQLVYDLSPQSQLLVYVSQPIPGEPADTTCPPGERVEPSDAPMVVTPGVARSSCVDWEVGGHHLISTQQTVGEPGHESYWFLSSDTKADGLYVSVIEKVQASGWTQAAQRSRLPFEQAVAIARSDGLDFPDPEVTPPAPSD